MSLLASPRATRAMGYVPSVMDEWVCSCPSAGDVAKFHDACGWN